ncbi:MAG: hypothetical protein AAF821_00050 [Cyanobacteria bacterium P01_D01_bin.156]
MNRSRFRLFTIVPLDLVLAFGLVSCGDIISDVVNGISSEAVAAAEQAGLVAAAPEPSLEAFTMVGAQKLTEHQVLSVLYLQWPQSHKAMESLLGPPELRDKAVDQYTMPNGNKMTILYNGSGMATGYTLGDSN